MTTRPRQRLARDQWLALPAGAGQYRHWLKYRGSLTQRLQARSSAFAVERLRLRWGRPQPDEARLLGIPRHARAWLREVTLCCAGTPVVFARSVLPKSSLYGPWRALASLGRQPLGTALFAKLHVVRAPLHYRKLAPAHMLYRHATASLATRPAYLWARRSVFWRGNAPILVTEVFLPGMLKLDM